MTAGEEPLQPGEGDRGVTRIPGGTEGDGVRFLELLRTIGNLKLMNCLSLDFPLTVFMPHLAAGN